jgi:hypothetical protein
MCRFMIKNTNVKMANLRRRSSAPALHLANVVTTGSESPSPSSQQSDHGWNLSEPSGLAEVSLPLTRMARRNTTVRRKKAGCIVPTFHNGCSYFSIEEDLEPLPHDNNENGFPRIIECGEHDRRSTKKHRSNNSWSPNLNTGGRSLAAMDWLSLAFGGTETSSTREEPPLVEENAEIFHKIIDVENYDDTHSIHSFSSLPMEQTTSIPRPSDKVLSLGHSDSSSEHDSKREVDASLNVLRSVRASA